MSLSSLLPILSPVSVNILHPAFIVVLNFWLSLDIFQKGQKSSACSMTFMATGNCFLPSKMGGRMLTMTKEHSRVSQPFCRSFSDLPLPRSLKKNKRQYLAKPCMHTNVCIKCFQVTWEPHDFKTSHNFLSKSIHKNEGSFMTGPGARNRNYSDEPENL